MKKILLCMASLVVFTGVAMADSTTATSTTQLNITVIAPVTLSCTTSITLNTLKAASGATTSSAHLVTCTVGGGAITGVSSAKLEWEVTDLNDLPSTDTLPATAISVSTTSGGTFVAATASGSYATVSNDTADSTLSASYPIYVEATVPADQVPAAYTGTMTERLTVTYAP